MNLFDYKVETNKFSLRRQLMKIRNFLKKTARHQTDLFGEHLTIFTIFFQNCHQTLTIT